MITETFFIPIFLIGMACLLLYRFTGKFWYIFFLIGIGLIGSLFLGMLMKNVIILKKNDSVYSYYTFYKNIEYKFNNGQTKSIEIVDNTLINDTENNLVVEEHTYSQYEVLAGDKNVILYITPFSIVQLKNKINYYYSEPPETISVRRSNEVVTKQYWLHK